MGGFALLNSETWFRALIGYRQFLDNFSCRYLRLISHRNRWPNWAKA